MQLRVVVPPKNSKEAIESRRKPCYGFGILAHIGDNKKLMSLLEEARNKIVKIVDPNRTPNDHGVHSPKYIKQKFFHAAFFGPPPLQDEDQYELIYANENGLLNSNRLGKMCDILRSHIIEKDPYLEPVECELMPDGTISSLCANILRGDINRGKSTVSILLPPGYVSPQNSCPCF